MAEEKCRHSHCRNGFHHRLSVPAAVALGSGEVRGSLQMQSFAKRLVPRAGLDSLVLAPNLKQRLGRVGRWLTGSQMWDGGRHGEA